jgi:hypothetical protein
VERANPDRVEFIEVRRENTDEFQPFHERNLCIFGGLENPFIETQPTEIAIFASLFLHCSPSFKRNLECSIAR